MAQLKDLLVTGDARVLGSVYADIPTNDLVPYATKTYTNIIGNSSDNNQAYNSFYFGYVRPNSFTETWEAKYRVHVWVPTNTNFEVVSDVLFKGSQTNINAYAIFNHILNTSYRPVYYHNVYRLNATGYNNGYGHALGISLSDSNSRGDTSLKRSFTIELIYAKNCTITLNDTAVLWANWSGTGSTNYSGLSNYNFASNGLQETGDNDDVCQLRSYYERPLVDTGKLYGYNLCTLTNNDKLTGFVTSYSTGTTKTKNTATFKINAPMYYYTSNVEKASGSYTGDNSLAYQIATVDFRYSSNCGTTLIANKPVYLVGIPNGTTYTLADTWWTQTLPSSADGKIYIYLGIAYDTYRIAWQVNHPIYWYKDGAIKLYIPSAGDLAYINKGSGSSKFLREDGTWQTVSSGGGTITDVKVDNQSIVSNGIANLKTMNSYNANTNPIATYNEIDMVEDEISAVEHMVSELGSEQWSNLSTLDYNGHTGATNVLEALENIEDGLFEVNDVLSYEKVDKEIAGTSTDKTFIDHDGSLMTLEASNTNNDTESSIRLYPNGNLSLYGDNVYINDKVAINSSGTTITGVIAPTNNSDAANKQYVDTQVATKQNTLVSGTNIKTINNQSLLGSGDLDIISGGDTLPVGAIIPYSGSTIPTNFLLADGSAVSRTTYSELFEAIGTTYGAGNGSTTFNLPNLKGKVPVGRDSNDTSFDVLGETGGEKTHQLTVNEMPSHAHDTPIHSGGSQGLLGFMGLTNGSSSTTLSGGSTFGIKNTGGSQAHNNLQPYITQNYIIKAKKSTTALDLGYITNTYSDSTTDTYSASYINNLLDSIYPVGSIYMSVNNTNPSVLFGGTWESWGAGRVPVGVDVNDTAFDTVEETGGEKTHTLTTTEMPSHGHSVTWQSNCPPWLQAGGYGQITASGSGGANKANIGSITINNTGGSGAHNNLQPYITCYMWKRTA